MTNEKMPRIEAVTVEGTGRLSVKWRGKARKDSVNLLGWIATGGKMLAPLMMPSIFNKASVGNYGAAIVWDEGDLAIDAQHVLMLAEEQKKFDEQDAKRWQEQVGLSNNEVADLFSLSTSTWSAYKAGAAEIPATIAMLCRAMLRDPVLMQAHYRPRINGRPPKRAAS
jgi:hypothetical protein